MKKKNVKRVEAVAQFLRDHSHLTGAQVRGPVWRGPRPMNQRGVATVARDPEVQKANEAIDQRRHPQMAFMPDSNLGKILLDPRVRRPLRRAIISAVQAPDTARRAKLERRVQRGLAAIGVTP